MDDKAFSDLLDSVRWAGKLVRGEPVPAKAIVALSADDVREKSWRNSSKSVSPRSATGNKVAATQPAPHVPC
jgi:hypothetical protein